MGFKSIAVASVIKVPGHANLIQKDITEVNQIADITIKISNMYKLCAPTWKVDTWCRATTGPCMTTVTDLERQDTI